MGDNGRQSGQEGGSIGAWHLTLLYMLPLLLRGLPSFSRLTSGQMRLDLSTRGT